MDFGVSPDIEDVQSGELANKWINHRQLVETKVQLSEAVIQELQAGTQNSVLYSGTSTV